VFPVAIASERVSRARGRRICNECRKKDGRPLKEGYIENESVVIAYRWAENQPHRLQELAADLVRRGVAAIVTAGPPATFAAKAATTTDPHLFLVGDYPVRLGLVASLARPGGNMTGINIFNVELAAKRLELLRELVPRAARIALAGPADVASPRAK
jgi:putative tryptophan/tyrosine transport system substrate-binding protein